MRVSLQITGINARRGEEIYFNFIEHKRAHTHTPSSRATESVRPDIEPTSISLSENRTLSVNLRGMLSMEVRGRTAFFQLQSS